MSSLLLGRLSHAVSLACEVTVAGSFSNGFSNFFNLWDSKPTRIFAEGQTTVIIPNDIIGTYSIEMILLSEEISL